MFSWFISLLMLFGYQSKTAYVPSVSPGGSGNQHVTTADNPQSNPVDQPDTDGKGQGGGG
jgi:hypothetical protein